MNKFDIFEPIFSELGIQKDISKIINCAGLLGPFRLPYEPLRPRTTHR